MIQYKDIISLIKEAEYNASSENLVRNKVKKEESPLFDLFDGLLDKSLTEICVQSEYHNKINSKQLEKLFSKRESYTIKKIAFDQLITKLFNQSNLTFFDHFFIHKITNKDTKFGYILKNDQIAYIYLNIIDQSVFKITKTVKIIDPVDGTIYNLENSYQNTGKGLFSINVESSTVSADIPFTYGVIILTKDNENSL